MNPTLHISLLQANLFWEDSMKNKSHFENLLSNFFENEENQNTDIVVLPEMFTTGFTMNVDLAEKIEDSPTLEWLKKNTKKYDVAITGSIIIEDDKKFYNRLFFVEPNGNYNYYDKKHLFRMADEQKTFTAGIEHLIFEYKGWKICPQICYDLRFPVFSRNRLNIDKDGIATSGYDILLYVANFPAARALAWNTLLPARAIENSCYAIGVNRIGKDGKEINYAGDSAIYNPKGEKLDSKIENIGETEILSYSLSATDLQEYRKKFQVYLDDDNFELK